MSDHEISLPPKLSEPISIHLDLNLPHLFCNLWRTPHNTIAKKKKQQTWAVKLQACMAISETVPKMDTDYNGNRIVREEDYTDLDIMIG
jgi:hypothetical protein